MVKSRNRQVEQIASRGIGIEESGVEEETLYRFRGCHYLKKEKDKEVDGLSFSTHLAYLNKSLRGRITQPDLT